MKHQGSVLKQKRPLHHVELQRLFSWTAYCARSCSIFVFGWILFFGLGTSASHASPIRSMKQGIKAYEAGKYKEALGHFTQAQVEAPDDAKVRFNRSSAQYRTGDYEEAAKGFEAVASGTRDAKLKEKAFYNLGNTAFRRGDLEAASDSYRKALDLDASDLQAKQNLEFVLREMEQKKQEQKAKENQGKNKDQGKEGEKQNSKGPSKKKEQRKQDRNSRAGRDQKPQEGNSEQAESPPDQEKRDQGGAAPTEPGAQDKNNQENLGQGKIQEAGSPGEEKDNGEAQGESRPGGRVLPLAPEEAERLLNSLNDDQRAFFRKQAEQAAGGKKRTARDW